jgi:hypothetical protein
MNEGAARIEKTLPGIQFVDLSKYFCDKTSCPAAVGQLLIYHDPSHITSSYASHLSPQLEQALVPAMGGL